LIAAPVNYRAHIDEANADKGINFGATVKSIEEYGLFLKASSAIVGPSEGVRLPPLNRRVDHEVELVAIIGKEGHRIPRDRALEHVAAYSIGLDMTVRGPEDRSWRKSFDTFAVIGPWLVTADEIPDPGDLDLRLTVNGALRQSSNTSALIFDVPRLVEYASSTYTLYPGDVIMTGTPEGVGPVVAGDVLECFIERIGEMRVPIHAAHGVNS
jgi:2-keto-4-pentenoate hydratase/2-oxohepta-3-ene-1,7-dioic acid hydratase in catechol pathway